MEATAAPLAPRDVVPSPTQLRILPGGSQQLTLTNAGPGDEGFLPFNVFLIAADGSFYQLELGGHGPPLVGPYPATTQTTVVAVLAVPQPPGYSATYTVLAPTVQGSYTLRFLFPALSLPVTVSDACASPATPVPTISPDLPATR